KFFEQVLADRRVEGQRDRITTVEAGRAQRGRRLLRGRDEVVQADVTETVRPDGAADSLDICAVGDQLGAGCEVDAVEARPAHRRAGDADVHLDGAGLAQHPDQRALGVAAHDGI